MKNDMLNALLHILINSPKVGSKEFEGVIDASVRAWLAAKPRRKCPPKFVSTPLVANSSGISENVVTVTMQDAGVQTNDDSVIQPVQRTIADEVDETSKTLDYQQMMMMIQIMALTFNFPMTYSVVLLSFIH